MVTEHDSALIAGLTANLGYGHQNAKTRESLATEMGMSDRAMRKLIEMARTEGCLILNNQDGRGYYLPSSIDDIAKQYKQDTNRAMAILVRRKHMRKLLKEAGLKV